MLFAARLSKTISRFRNISRVTVNGNVNFRYVPCSEGRSFSSSKLRFSNYEGDGKTTVSLLNKEYQHLVLISSISTHGFRLNNGLFVVGPIAVFPRTVLQWNVASVSDITPSTLSLFCLLEPKIDILVIGTGEKSEMLSKEAILWLKAHKISPEILSTENAIATFNYLNVEGRCVAGALLCPTEIKTFIRQMTLIKENKNLETFWEEEPVKKIDS